MDLPSEIERRFIASLQDLEEAKLKAPEILITDVYVEDDNAPPLRVRTSDFSDGRRTVVIAVKLGEGLKRAEPQWRVLSVQAQGPWLRKARYPWTKGDLSFHVEQLKLGPVNPIMAEVEFLSEEDAVTFVPPAHWVEVTGDKRYSNFSIAKHGWPGAPK